MKKFLNEYKATKCNKSEPELLRERVTVTTRQNATSPPSTPDLPQRHSSTQIGTIRTEEYKRDLAEFQARRSSGVKETELTPVKKKCGRHSLPVGCTDCSTDHDNTFNYEKKSAVKYKKHKRARSTTPEQIYEGVPNIQFLFQNQVFMPGGKMFTTASYSEPQKSKRHTRRSAGRSPDFAVQKHIDFTDNDREHSPPEFMTNSSLPFDVKNFLEGSRNEEEVDGLNAAGDVKVPSHSFKDDSDDKLWEVMSELKHLDQWADEQLLMKSPSASRSDDSKSDTSAYGLPVASARSLDINTDMQKVWNHGRWGVVPVQIKRLGGVSVDHVRKKRNTEINILRKCRHPNIILLMGIYPDINNNVNIICERCVDSLFSILHVQGRILSAQTSVQYTLDIANALVFLRMQGYIHTELSSLAIMITSHDTAKLADLGPCVKVDKGDKRVKGIDKDYEIYSPEPQYVNIEDTQEAKSSDNEPLLSADPSETYIKSNAVSKPYESYQSSELYRWHAPELFSADGGVLHPCSKSDVYSLSLVLWESCNATMPWKQLSYDKLKEHYTLWKAGVRLPADGTYPGALLALLQAGLRVERGTRSDLQSFQRTLQTVKGHLDSLGYIIIPARLSTQKSTFSNAAWDTTTPTDSDCQSPPNIDHRAVIHKAKEPLDSYTDSSEKEGSKSDAPVYETITQTYKNTTYSVAQKCFIQNDDNTENVSLTKYELLPDKDYSSACSTPIAKLKARMKDIDTPGTLHRSDSTEYCSILSPNRTNNLGLNDDSYKGQSSVERATAKLSRSFTPKSYKPLHIKVPEYNLDSIKPLLKDQNSMERSSYNFDIKNYSLPSTPIARSNKLRKNAWLSGDVGGAEGRASGGASADSRNRLFKTPSKEDSVNVQPDERSPESIGTIPKSTSCSPDIRINSENNTTSRDESVEPSPVSVDTVKDTVLAQRRSSLPENGLTSESEDTQENNTWAFKSSLNPTHKSKIEEELLANMSVKPLVAIHERWIYEANRKAGRAMSLPEENSFRSQISAVKPASHCVDTLLSSLPQLHAKKPTTTFRMTTSPNNDAHWEQFCQARDTIAKGVNFAARSPEQCHARKTEHTDSDKGTSTEDRIRAKIDQCTDTKGIEDFIRDLIRKEFQHLLQEMSDDASTVSCSRNEDIVNKGVSNIMESLNNDDAERVAKKDSVKSFSRVKINGNNKPLLQITFSRSGENSLQVLDNCVNVTICDNASRDKLNVSMEDTLTDDAPLGGLKRCQAFNAIQEARSTEDLYIDDDLSTHMQENFGGKVKLIPLHGSLHEILCEKEDECCLIKVKQENGCDTIYFRCDNSDTESRDAIDGCELPQDTVVFKRSISLIEERIQRIIPKDKRAQTPILPRKKDLKTRPKSEVFAPISRETRVLSNSSPSLAMIDKDEVEVNIENVMCYQDSSSDECLKCQADDDFELLEREIEQDIATHNSMSCGCLEKISEENLSTMNEDTTEMESIVVALDSSRTKIL